MTKDVHIKKSKKLKICLIFIKVFNFWGGKPKFTHVFSHFCLPFPYFFGQVMHFCKFRWIDLIHTYHKSLPKNSSIVAYWQALENDYPKQVPWNFPPNPTYHNLQLILGLYSLCWPQWIIVQQFYQFFSQSLFDNMY